MYKDELLEKININSIVGLLNYLECDRDFERITLENVRLGNSVYNIYKIGDNLSIYSKNKPLLMLVNREIDPKCVYDYGNREIRISYKLDNNDLISFEGNTKITDSLIDKDNLINNLKPYYYKGKNLDKIELKDDLLPYGIDSCEEGIRYHNLILSDDGKEILKINGEDIPSKKEIEAFDVEEEKRKAHSLYSILDFNGVTKMMFNKSFGDIDKDKIDNFVQKLEKKNTYLKNFSKDYDRVTDKVTSLVEIRDNFVNGTKTIDYSEDELNKIFNKLFSLSKEKRFDKEALMEQEIKKDRELTKEIM